MLVYLNGEYLPREEAKISVEDRGFVFGDGLYEVTRAVRGALFQEEAHWRRLERGLRELEIDTGGALDPDVVREVSGRLLRENGLSGGEATVYLQVTRGSAVRTHWFPPAGTRATVFLSAAPFQVPVEQRRAGVDAITLPDVRWSRCDLKTVNLLGSVMTKQKAREAGAYDAVLLRDGVVTEGGSSNVFAVIDGVLRTYPVSNYILPGVTRALLLELARDLEIPLGEMPVLVHELPRAHELFFSGTTTDVQPIVRLDGEPVGDGRPGPATLSLMRALYERMAVRVDV